MSNNTWTIEEPQPPKKTACRLLVQIGLPDAPKNGMWGGHHEPTADDWPHIAALASQHAPAAKPQSTTELCPGCAHWNGKHCQIEGMTFTSKDGALHCSRSSRSPAPAASGAVPHATLDAWAATLREANARADAADEGARMAGDRVARLVESINLERERSARLNEECTDRARQHGRDVEKIDELATELSMAEKSAEDRRERAKAAERRVEGLEALALALDEDPRTPGREQRVAAARAAISAPTSGRTVDRPTPAMLDDDDDTPAAAEPAKTCGTCGHGPRNESTNPCVECIQHVTAPKWIPKPAPKTCGTCGTQIAEGETCPKSPPCPLRMPSPAQGGAKPTPAMRNDDDSRSDYEATHPAPDAFIDIVFDGPPGPVCGRFVEVEDPDGRSVGADVGGEWIDRKNGLWALRIPRASPHTQTSAGDRFLESFDRLIENHGPGYVPHILLSIREKVRAPTAMHPLGNWQDDGPQIREAMNWIATVQGTEPFGWITEEAVKTLRKHGGVVAHVNSVLDKSDKVIPIYLAPPAPPAEAKLSWHEIVEGRVPHPAPDAGQGDATLTCPHGACYCGLPSPPDAAVMRVVEAARKWTASTPVSPVAWSAEHERDAGELRDALRALDAAGGKGGSK